MLTCAPVIEVIQLPLPDRAGPYRWKPEPLSEPGVRLRRLLHNGVSQPRGRRDLEAIQEGAWPYRVLAGEIVWSCYEWLAPKTHKIRIEVDRTVQATAHLTAWLRDHPDALGSDDPLAAAAAGCDDRWVRALAADPGFEASFSLVWLVAGRR